MLRPSKALLVRLTSLALVAAWACAPVSAALVFDAAADFSIVSNPNGPWTYGTTGLTTTGLLAPFVISTPTYGGYSDYPAWTGAEPAFTTLYPVVSKNESNVSQVVGAGYVPLDPGQLDLHPGPSGTYSVIRFTNPTEGTYDLSAVFEGRDIRGGSTDVHVLLNGLSLFDGVVLGTGAASDQSYQTTFLLHVGDNVDFAVGYGPNGDFFADSTALAATLSAVPETTPLALIPVALLAAGCGLRWPRPRSS